MKILLLMAGVLSAVSVAAQQAPSASAGATPAFEVASVERYPSGERSTVSNHLPRTR